MGTRSAGVGAGLAEVQTGVGTFIAYSTQPGNVALDGAGRNSPFTEALVRHLREKRQSLTAVMIAVRKDVLASTGGRQVPWDHSALTGEFFFDLAAAGQPIAKPPLATGETAQELNERLQRLESELKRRTKAAAIASNATLVELRQRQRQLENQTRSDWDRIFRMQREQAQERDGQKRINLSQEIGRMQFEISRRDRDVADLRAEIQKVEKGVAPERTEAGEKKP
jgi:uncharacterized caspase-like protein